MGKPQAYAEMVWFPERNSHGWLAPWAQSQSATPAFCDLLLKCFTTAEICELCRVLANAHNPFFNKTELVAILERASKLAPFSELAPSLFSLSRRPEIFSALTATLRRCCRPVNEWGVRHPAAPEA